MKTYLQEKDVRSNKKKTKVKKQTLNPVFDEILVVSVDFVSLNKVSAIVLFPQRQLSCKIFIKNVFHIAIT